MRLGLTFSRTLQTYWHQRMRKMMMTKSRMMVTRQPIRTGVLLLSGGELADGLGAAGKNSDVRKVEFEGDCKAAAKTFSLKRCFLFFLTHIHLLPYGMIKGNRYNTAFHWDCYTLSR